MKKKACYMWTQESSIKLVNYDNNKVDFISNPQENASNLCQYILDTTPGFTFDEITDFIAQRMIDVFNNPYAEKSHFTDKQHISNHVRIALSELAQLHNL